MTKKQTAGFQQQLVVAESIMGRGRTPDVIVKKVPDDADSACDRQPDDPSGIVNGECSYDSEMHACPPV
ncbi:hypothetical protein EYF80_046817 [Liparis tanakae]|uniref:Uncharacterized protein n=1 Tax=Liparis tanakae TaxID=230148 RepID=A0A4Z2FP39_9TELE|nr:hypothetical protein EYF80_046817 [Liparis tanakae]